MSKAVDKHRVKCYYYNENSTITFLLCTVENRIQFSANPAKAGDAKLKGLIHTPWNGSQLHFSQGAAVYGSALRVLRQAHRSFRELMRIRKNNSYKFQEVVKIEKIYRKADGVHAGSESRGVRPRICLCGRGL